MEISRVAHFDSLIVSMLERPMCRLDCAVFVTDAQIVHRRFHVVVLAQCLVTLHQLAFLGCIDIRGAKAVCTMLRRRAAEFMQGSL